ncbi:hypothetical protein [Parabacteroides sp.]
MKNRLNQYKRLPLLAGLFALIAFGCVSGERGGNGDPDLPEMVEVDLQVGVSDVSGSLQTKASADDLKPLDGELIHSLVVFIVDASGKVEKKFQPDLSNNTGAQAGNLENWKSGSFEVTRGVKRIYAFANWELLKDHSFISTAEGVTLVPPDIVEWENNSFDPVNKKFLPMSFSETWTVSAGTKKIELVRLVSRMKVFIRNEAGHDITINHLKISPFNTKSYLFGKDGNTILPTTGNEWSIVDILDNVSLTTTTDAQEASSGWIYVNESATDNGFEVALETISKGTFSHATDFHGGTKRTSFVKRIPRNRVWNLRLVFASYKLTLGIEGENPPIGGYPDVMTNVEEDTNLACEIFGGGPFTLEIKKLESLESGNNYDVNKLAWSIGNINNESGLLVGTPLLTINGTKITGRMVGAATGDQDSATFILEVRNTEENRTLSFTVTLRFKDIFAS